MNIHQVRAISALEAVKGDDLRRAEKAFEGWSDEELDEIYGGSGRTAREILSGYREYERRINDAIEWVKGLNEIRTDQDFAERRCGGMNEFDKRRNELIAREAGKPGLRGRINAKCIECIVDPYSNGGTWKQQIEACTDTNCPLYDVRPMPDYETEEQKRKRLARGSKA